MGPFDIIPKKQVLLRSIKIWLINDRLSKRLNEPCLYFRRCNYPIGMLESIFTKIKRMERIVTKKKATNESVNVISSHGWDKELVKVLKRVENNSEKISFRYTKKTAPSLQNTLVRSKISSLGQPKGKTMPCKTKRNNCMACKMVSQKDHVTGPKNKTVGTAKATSKSHLSNLPCILPSL